MIKQDHGWSNKKRKKINEPHIKRVHKSGLLKINHADPRDIFGADCPIEIIDLYTNLQHVFGRYSATVLDLAAKKDGIKCVSTNKVQRLVDYK